MSLIFQEFDKEEPLKNKKYSIGLDLSTVSTGMALYDIEKEKIIETRAVTYDKENKIFVQAEIISQQIEEWKERYSLTIDNTIYAKEKQPVQYGAKTTVNTLISIAKLHGLIENKFFIDKIPLLDLAVPTIRKVVVSNYKAEKEEVYDFIQNKFSELNLVGKSGKDISDAIAVCLAAKEGMVQEYKETIKELTKEKKGYKTVAKQQLIEEKINKIKRKLG